MKKQTIKKASEIIKQGGLVAFPTETVYGLGANALDNAACLRIYKAKERPANNPLIVHVLSLEQAETLAYFNNDAYKLSALWPGPLTMVLPIKSQQLARCVTAGLDTVALRIPAHPVARELIMQSGVPIAAPSANKSGRLSPTTHDHVKGNFGDEIFVIPAEETSRYGLESTIIDLSTKTPAILRFGFITPELIEQILDKKVEVATKSSKIKAPGMMYLHYAPQASLRIMAEFLMAGEVGLGFGDNRLDLLHNVKGGRTLLAHSLNLSSTGDLTEAAANLFSYLHLLDDYAQKNHATGIAVAPIPSHGIGLAINDRLMRASGKR